MRYSSRLDLLNGRKVFFCKTSFRRSIAGLNILEAVYDGMVYNRERLLAAFIDGVEKLGWK